LNLLSCRLAVSMEEVKLLSDVVKDQQIERHQLAMEHSTNANAVVTPVKHTVKAATANDLSPPPTPPPRSRSSKPRTPTPPPRRTRTPKQSRREETLWPATTPAPPPSPSPARALQPAIVPSPAPAASPHDLAADASRSPAPVPQPAATTVAVSVVSRAQKASRAKRINVKPVRVERVADEAKVELRPPEPPPRSPRLSSGGDEPRPRSSADPQAVARQASPDLLTTDPDPKRWDASPRHSAGADASSPTRDSMMPVYMLPRRSSFPEQSVRTSTDYV